MEKLSIFISFALFAFASASYQSSCATAELRCNNYYAQGVHVQLFDRDLLDPDDLMADQYTNQDGRFFNSGNTESISRIKPYIKIQHVCTPDGQLSCVEYNVPDEFITDGAVARNCWDMGIVELAGTPSIC